jgi:hypothetical protein
VIWRPGQLGVPREPRFGWFWFGNWISDGGEDAPLTAKGRFRYDLIIVAIILVGVGLIAWARFA